MPAEINSASQVSVSQTFQSNRLRQGLDVSRGNENQEVREDISASTQQDRAAENEQTQQRRAQALQQLERDNFRLRRDDNSDLPLRAQQAVNTFNDVNQQQEQQDASELLGIDTFA